MPVATRGQQERAGVGGHPPPAKVRVPVEGGKVLRARGENHAAPAGNRPSNNRASAATGRITDALA
jgi:hypothetical protein